MAFTVIFAGNRYYMPRTSVFMFLLSVWLFAILAPPLITILSEGNKTMVTVNLNEEEQQEQGKKSIDKKLFATGTGNDYLLLSRLRESLSADRYVLKIYGRTSEIDLPPPEYNF